MYPEPFNIINALKFPLIAVSGPAKRNEPAAPQTVLRSRRGAETSLLTLTGLCGLEVRSVMIVKRQIPPPFKSLVLLEG